MPVEFLTAGQRADYGRYATEPTAVELARCFHLNDADHQFLAGKRGNASFRPLLFCHDGPAVSRS